MAQHVDTVIFVASAVAVEPEDKLKQPIQPALWWVLSTIIRGSRAPKRLLMAGIAWQESIHPLLHNKDCANLTWGNSAAHPNHLINLWNAVFVQR